MKVSDQMHSEKYSYFVNVMLFLFALFVNINNTLADIALFSLSMAGVYILIKKNINPFKDSRLRILLLITTGYYFINLIVFFINGTGFDKYLQTDVYFLLAVFVAAAILYAKVNINLFFSGIRLALLFLGACHLLSFDCSNIYISIFAPITVLMMFLSIINYDNDNLTSRIFGLAAFACGAVLVLDSGVRLSWLVFIFLTIVVSFLMFKKVKVNKISLVVSLLLLTVFISFISSNNKINNRLTAAYNNISDWSSDKNVKSSVGVRLEMYKSGLEAFKEKPFFGHGYLNGTKAASKYADPRVKNQISNYVQMHSEYITTIVEKGFFGLLAMGMLLLVPFLIIVRNYCKDDIFIRIGIVTSTSFILFSLFNVSFGDTTFKVFYVLLICLFLTNIYKEKFR